MSTLINNVRLWDGTAEEAIANAALLVDNDGNIAWAGARDGAPAAARTADIADGGGGTLLPGLIDAHIHLSWGDAARPHPGGPVMTAMAVAADALSLGVTAVRDLGERDHSAIEAAHRAAAGAVAPHIIAAGRPVALPHGYFAGVAHEVSDPEGVRAAIAAEVAAGAGVIKVIASPVPVAADVRLPRSLGPENLHAACAAAHAAGRRVTAHAHSRDGARDAVLAGFDCIEHGYRLDTGTIAEMARRGTWLVPTLVAMEAAQRPMMAVAEPDERSARARERWEAAVGASRAAHAAGVPIATGTDATAVVPVTAIVREVVLLVEAAGLSPVEALRAATGNGARLLGIEHITGRIAPGLRADLLLVDGDPLADPTALARVRGVWRAGRRLAVHV